MQAIPAASSPPAPASTPTPPAREPRQHLPLSAHAAPEVVFAWERFHAIAREIAAPFAQHAAEVNVETAHIPIEPDWNRLLQLDLAGILHVLTARFEGRLVGYVVDFVLPSLQHASTLSAIVEGVWLDPVYRQGWTGYNLLKENDAGLRRLGARFARFEVTSHFAADRGTLGLLLKRLGYKLVGHTYLRLLE
jgi:hypothetical protein